MSDTDSGDSCAEVKSKKRKYKQNYRNHWEKQYPFLTALKEKPNFAKCKICNSQLVADISVIKRHAEGSVHIKKAKLLSTTSKITDAFSINSQQLVMENNVKRAEIKITAFLAEHNIAFKAADHLVPLLKQCFKDSQIAQHLNMGRTKATGVVQHVIAKTHKEMLIQCLKTQKFSILIDESTDISDTKILCICVRYYSKEDKKIISQFWELVQVFSKEDAEGAIIGATAARMYEEMISTFKIHNIPDNNIVGFASDGCNSMMGVNNSVSSRLRTNYPGIIISKCICHSFHLCASEACKILPRACEEMARDIYNYFKTSAKRQAQFAEFQHFCEVEPHKILKPAQTRWFSLLSVINRILEQWEPLRLYFTSVISEDRLFCCENILNSLRNPSNKLFYLFLAYILPKFVGLNEYFQSEKTAITNLNSKVCEVYRELLATYMDVCYINRMDIDEIDCTNEKQFVDINSMYLGISVYDNLSTVDVQLKLDFLSRCRQFLITACKQIKKRFNFKDPILTKINILDPRCKIRPTSLLPLIKAAPRVTDGADVQIIDDEWRKCLISDFKIEYNEIDEYWVKLGDLQDLVGTYLFKNVSKFALDVLIYPHSNATCERVFSKVNLIKTRARNRLCTKTIASLLLACDRIKGQCGCNNFEPNSSMFNLMNSTNLYSGQKDENEGDGDDFTFNE